MKNIYNNINKITIMSEQAQWDSTLSFLFAMIGVAVGLGNIWRFSYVVYTKFMQSYLLEYWHCHYYLQKGKLHQIKIKLTKKKEKVKIKSLLSYFFIEAIALCAPCFT